MVSETKERFYQLFKLQFLDKGFHSPANQTKTGVKYSTKWHCLAKANAPKKIQELESSEDFQRAHDKHSAVESAINALEVHGLDRCPRSWLGRL